MPPDKIDEAISATEEKVVQVEMAAVGVKLLNNDARPAHIAVPTDISELEVLSLIASIIQITDQLRAKRPNSRIIVPGRIQ